MWNSGDAHRFTSSSANSRQTRMSVSDWHMRFWWDSIAPLGRPVVPEVYMIRAGLSSGTSTVGDVADPVIAPLGVRVVHGPFLPLMSAKGHCWEGADVREPDPARPRRPRARAGSGRSRLGTARGLSRLGRKVEPDLRADQRRGRGGAAQAARRAAAAAGARHGPGGPGAARAGAHRRPGSGHPARG